MKLLLSMGLKPNGRASEPLQPHLRLLDTDTGEVETLLTRTMSAALHPGDHEHAEFTGATVHGDLLWQCTRTEVLALRWPTLEVVHHITHPYLHDVHHVVPTSRGIAVASTGNDSVVELSLEGTLLAHHWLRQGSFAETYGVTDFRRLPFDATKPRQHHPNFLRVDEGDLWVTCLQSQQCTRLAGGRTIRFDGSPHDGRLLDGEVWFTTTDGRVHAHDPSSLSCIRSLDLAEIDDTPGLAGWCRGVEKVGDDLYVGMTMLRSSVHRELLRRAIRGRAGEKRATRVVRVDLRTNRVSGSWQVGNRAGGTIYGLHMVSM